MNNDPRENTVAMKCRNTKCTSMKAYEIPQNRGGRIYRCSKCGHGWTAPVGGKFTLNSI